MAKHYLQLNDKKEIIKGYSDEFSIEVPLSELTLINKEGGRHFEIEGSAELRDGTVYLYRYEKGGIIKKTEEEILKEQAELLKNQVPPTDRMDELEHAVMEMGEVVSEISERIGE